MILPITEGGNTYYWSSPEASAVETPVITVAENPFLFSTTVTITCETEDAVIKYSYDGENWSDYSSALTITETKTIYAKAIKGEDESTIAQVTATKNLATPIVTVSGDLTLDLDGETNVSAGSVTATVTYNDAAVEGATVTWSSSNTNVATIDASTGAVTIISIGEVTFTATYAGNSDYAEAIGTKTVIVTDSKAPGTENNPYTVAQARAAIDAGTGITGVYATGIVTAIPTAWSSQYNNITFTFVDNSGDTDVLQAYRCVSTDNADASMVAVGDIVVVYGNLTNYQGTYEFYNPCQLVSLIHPSAVTFDPESSEQDGTYTVNITAESGTIYYIEQTKMIYLDLETGYPTETNTGVLNPAAVVYSGTLTYSQPMMVTAVAVDANGNISDATTAIYTYTGAVTPPYYETFSDYSGGFTAEKEANGPEWEIRSNTGQQAIANWGEERHYEYVSGSSANTYENNITRYYGTADLISPIINLIGVTDPSFFFIHAGHKFYSDPNTTAIKNTGLETTLDDEVAKYSCKVYVGISDANGNVTTWNQIPWGEGGATFFTQKFRANEYTNEDCTVTSSNDSRSGQFIRVNSGEISLDAYKNNYIRIKFEYTSDSEHYGTWNVDKFQVNASKTEKIEMNAKGWTTYVIDHDIDAYQTTLNIGGLQIFKVTEFDNTTAVLQQLGIVENHDSDVDDSERYLPAKTPIVVHGPAGQEIDFVIYQSPEVLPKVKNNLLYASLDPNLAKATSGVRYFVLQMKENADLPYFNKLKEGRAVPDHKAYLNGEQQVEAITSQTNAARGLFVMRDLTNGDSVVSEDGGFVDGIESIDEDTGNAVWHSISGVRVNHPTKGIYIVNGKKVIIK
ncbi:MAG: chitobiase/beta-hexosaminidase C-terminal domain-containing protein [Prevotella sp.]|nr:chitobiase/beta-hexosaminidase C-terminal domain-containing protein [Prevotella sp.]